MRNLSTFNHSNNAHAQPVTERSHDRTTWVQDVVKRRVVPPEAVEEMKERIEDMQADIDAITEEEKVERQLRIADMEQVTSLAHLWFSCVL
jgi:hypothetical protein